MSEEKNYVLECIASWAIAVDTAKDNSTLLLRSWQDNHEKCGQRMKEIASREDDLMRIADRPDLPLPLTRYIRAKDDMGCSSCWLAASGPKHDECEVKITEYFAAKDNLVTFGLGFTSKLF